MSNQEGKNIVNNSKWNALLIGLLITLLGWITNRTLNNIDNSIKDLSSEMKKKIEEIGTVTNGLDVRVSKIEERQRLESEMNNKPLK
jgi:hypothetical protein